MLGNSEKEKRAKKRISISEEEKNAEKNDRFRKAMKKRSNKAAVRTFPRPRTSKMPVYVEAEADECMMRTKGE